MLPPMIQDFPAYLQSCYTSQPLQFGRFFRHGGAPLWLSSGCFELIGRKRFPQGAAADPLLPQIFLDLHKGFLNAHQLSTGHQKVHRDHPLWQPWLERVNPEVCGWIFPEVSGKKQRNLLYKLGCPPSQ